MCSRLGCCGDACASLRERLRALPTRLRWLERGGGSRSATTAVTRGETQLLLRLRVNVPSSAPREGGHIQLQPAALTNRSCGALLTGPPRTFGPLVGFREEMLRISGPPHLPHTRPLKSQVFHRCTGLFSWSSPFTLDLASPPPALAPH